jgi:hypothetical protein
MSLPDTHPAVLYAEEYVHEQWTRKEARDQRDLWYPLKVAALVPVLLFACFLVVGLFWAPIWVPVWLLTR